MIAKQTEEEWIDKWHKIKVKMNDRIEFCIY